MQAISKNRTFLMGIAIALIMFCHNSLQISQPYIALGWVALSDIAQCGVDIFLFLSGFGLFYSYSKSPEYLPFLKKRFLRIVPKYLIVVIPYATLLCLFNFCSFHEALDRYSLVGFFITGNRSQWFIAAILVLYLLFPLVYKLVQKNLLWMGASVFIWIFSILLRTLLPYSNIDTVSEIFFIRIPIFIIGTKFGQIALRGEGDGRLVSFMKTHSGILTLLFFALCAVIRLFAFEYVWVYLRLAFTPLSLALCFFLCKIREKLNEKVVRFITMMGAITLEIYLTHEKIRDICELICEKMKIPGAFLQSLVANVAAIVMAIGFCYLFSKLYDKIFHLKKHSVA